MMFFFLRNVVLQSCIHGREKGRPRKSSVCMMDPLMQTEILMLDMRSIK